MKTHSIKINAILNIIYTISNIIFPLITFPYVSRIILAEGTGKVSFFTSVANYAVMIASVGVSTYGIRETAKVRDNKQKLSQVVAELLSINFVTTVIVLLILIISTSYVEKFRVERELFTIYCILIFSSVFSISWFYSGLEQYGYITKRTILVKIISVILVFSFVKHKNDYLIYAAITVFSSVGSYLINFIYARKFIDFKKLSKFNLMRHFKPMMLLFSSVLAVSVYTNLDTIMLGFICTDTEVGLYTVAVKMKWLLLNSVNAISAVLLPRLSYYLNNNKVEEFNKILKKSISVIMLISAPLTLFFSYEAKDCILFLGGVDYLDAVVCMRIVMPILLISGISNIVGNQILIPLDKDSCFMYAVVTGSVADIILNIILMPKYGCVGAAWATLIAEFIQMLVQIMYGREYIIRNINWKTIYKIILASVISSAGLIGIKHLFSFKSIVNIIIYGFIFFGLYIICLFALKERLTEEAFNEIRRRI